MLFILKYTLNYTTVIEIEGYVNKLVILLLRLIFIRILRSHLLKYLKWENLHQLDEINQKFHQNLFTYLPKIFQYCPASVSSVVAGLQHEFGYISLNKYVGIKILYKWVKWCVFKKILSTLSTF